MESYRTEDEQVEALKRWWKENGTSTLLGIGVVLAGWFGWQAWDKNQLQTASAASGNYQQLLQVSMELEQQPSDARYATASHLAETLKGEFGKTVYARYAALMQAKLLVEQGDLGGAEVQLRWVLDSDPEPAMRQLTNLRLARVMFSAGQGEQALAQMNEADYGEFAAIYYELRGDIHSSEGDLDAARSDYQRALEQGAGNPNASPLVRMKLESLPRDMSADSVVVDEAE